MSGRAARKRLVWYRKKGHKHELHTSTKMQKKEFQRKLRNGKHVDLVNGNMYRKVDGHAKWKYVS